MSELRHKIALAIMKGISEDNRKVEPGGHSMAEFLDPDTCHRAADEVIATLMSELTGQIFKTKFHSWTIMPAQFESDGIIYK